MLDEYRKKVILSYKEKRESGQLSSNLTHPSPRKLKDECLITLKMRTQSTDEKIIKDFFNSGAESNDYSHSIRKFDRDKLKPLDNFLKGETEATDDKNVELLAWLINFEPRPYKFGVDYLADINPNQESITLDSSDTAKENVDFPIVDPSEKIRLDESQTSIDSKWKGTPLFKRPFFLITIPLLLTSGIYLYTKNWTQAYICDRGTAKKYHLSSKCPALKNCKNNFVSTTIAEAEKNGKTLCGWEK